MQSIHFWPIIMGCLANNDPLGAKHYPHQKIHETLSGWWARATPLKNMTPSIGMMNATQYFWENAKFMATKLSGKIKFMFQTTNQLYPESPVNHFFSHPFPGALWDFVGDTQVPPVASQHVKPLHPSVPGNVSTSGTTLRIQSDQEMNMDWQFGRFAEGSYPNSWMVYIGKSYPKWMIWGYPHPCRKQQQINSGKEWINNGWTTLPRDTSTRRTTM